MASGKERRPQQASDDWADDVHGIHSTSVYEVMASKERRPQQASDDSEDDVHEPQRPNEGTGAQQKRSSDSIGSMASAATNYTTEDPQFSELRVHLKHRPSESSDNVDSQSCGFQGSQRNSAQNQPSRHVPWYILDTSTLINLAEWGVLKQLLEQLPQQTLIIIPFMAMTELENKSKDAKRGLWAQEAHTILNSFSGTGLDFETIGEQYKSIDAFNRYVSKDEPEPGDDFILACALRYSDLSMTGVTLVTDDEELKERAKECEADVEVLGTREAFPHFLSCKVQKASVDNAQDMDNHRRSTLAGKTTHSHPFCTFSPPVMGETTANVPSVVTSMELVDASTSLPDGPNINTAAEIPHHMNLTNSTTSMPANSGVQTATEAPVRPRAVRMPVSRTTSTEDIRIDPNSFTSTTSAVFPPNPESGQIKRRYTHIPEEDQLKKCQQCGSTRNLFSCLICGHDGCGPRVKNHAYDHFKTSQHQLAREVRSDLNNMVWNFKHNDYLHRQVQKSIEMHKKR